MRIARILADRLVCSVFPSPIPAESTFLIFANGDLLINSSGERLTTTATL